MLLFNFRNNIISLFFIPSSEPKQIALLCLSTNSIKFVMAAHMRMLHGCSHAGAVGVVRTAGDVDYCAYDVRTMFVRMMYVRCSYD